MTEIAFHFNAPDKLAYACRLLRKAVSSGAQVVVTGEPASLSALDTQLWTFAALEFVPHCRADSPVEQRLASPVILSARKAKTEQGGKRKKYVNNAKGKTFAILIQKRKGVKN